MFGVGIEFSIKDLLAVRRHRHPRRDRPVHRRDALGIASGWRSAGASAAGSSSGLAVSVASTVVLLRRLEDRGELDTPQGRIAVGWLIVEDLFTVVILVLLPTIAPLLGGSAPDGPRPDAASGRSVTSSWRSARRRSSP